MAAPGAVLMLVIDAFVSDTPAVDPEERIARSALMETGKVKVIGTVIFPLTTPPEIAPVVVPNLMVAADTRPLHAPLEKLDEPARDWPMNTPLPGVPPGVS